MVNVGIGFLRVSVHLRMGWSFSALASMYNEPCEMLRRLCRELANGVSANGHMSSWRFYPAFLTIAKSRVTGLKEKAKPRKKTRARTNAAFYNSSTLRLHQENLADNKHKMLVKHIYIGHLLIAFSRQQVPLFENREYDRLSFVRAYLNIQCDYMKFTHNPYERTHKKSITSKPWPSSLSLTTSASLLSSS